MTGSKNALFLTGAVVVVLVLGVAGLRVLGSPSEERARRLDDRRVADLRGVAEAADLYWTRHDSLPASLEALASEPGLRVTTSDPASAEPYEYAVFDSIAYELCATFEMASGDRVGGVNDDVWVHGVGRACFRLEARTVDRPDNDRSRR